MWHSLVRQSNCLLKKTALKKEWLLTYGQKENIHCNLQSFSELLYNDNDDEEDNSSDDDDDDDDIDNNSVIYPRQYL